MNQSCDFSTKLDISERWENKFVVTFLTEMNIEISKFLIANSSIVNILKLFLKFDYQTYFLQQKN